MGFHRKAMCFVSNAAATLSTTANAAILLEPRQMTWPIRAETFLKQGLKKQYECILVF